MYAATTTVPVEKTQGEIRKLLNNNKSSAFAIAEANDKAELRFEIQNRRVVFRLPMPPKPRWPKEQNQYDQKVRSRWRGLLLVLKAKFEAVESGITSIEQEFLAHILLPDGRVMGEWAIPQIQESYEKREMPPLLGDGRAVN